jgi:hypothetical protein
VQGKPRADSAYQRLEPDHFVDDIGHAEASGDSMTAQFFLDDVGRVR